MRIIIVFFLLSAYGFTQSNLTDLKFETDYFDAVDNWVAFPKIDDKLVYDYGYIFLDVHSGFSYKYESKFLIEEKNIKEVENDTTVGFVKFILDKNTKKVSILNKAQVKALNLPDEPSWLKAFKKGEENVNYLLKKGYYFNSVGASEKALSYLQKAYKKEPHYSGLEYELGYAYNAVKNFDEAIKILEKAIDNDPLNIGFYKELGYTYEILKKTEDAEKMYRLAIRLTNEDANKLNFAYRMMLYYYELKNQPKFIEWANMVLSFSKNNPKYEEYIKDHSNKWETN